MRARTVVMLTTSLPHDGDPSAGAFVREMAVALGRRGMRVVLLGSVPRGRSPLGAEGVVVDAVEDVEDGVFSGGGAPERLSLGRRGVDAAAWLRAGRGVASLAALAARHARDADGWVSHFALPSAPLVGALRGGRPHLAVAHGSDAWLLARAPRAVRRAVLASATAWRFTWPGIMDALGADARVPVEVAPMGFWPAAGEVAGRDVVVSVGRLVPVKRYGLAAEAMARAALPWVVLGEGPERARLEARARSLGVDARFEGAVDATTRDAWLRRARVFLHTAGGAAGGRGEGAPVALLEAMGAGAPVVATASGGVRWLIGDAGVVLDGGAEGAVIGDAVAHAWRAHPTGDAAAVERVSAWRWDVQAEAIERRLWGG